MVLHGRSRYAATILLLFSIFLSGCTLDEIGSGFPEFVLGGWTDPSGVAGNFIRFRGLKVQSPGTMGTAIEGRIELLSGSPIQRTVGVWNIGYVEPDVILNVIFDNRLEQWLIRESGPRRAILWTTDDVDAFHTSGWESRPDVRRRELTRVDADWNPSPKLSDDELHLRSGATLAN